MEVAEQEGGENARGSNKKPAATSTSKNDVPETHTNAGDADRSDSDESDDSVWPILASYQGVFISDECLQHLSWHVLEHSFYDLDFFFLIVDLVVSLLKNIPTFVEMNQS